MAKTGTIVVALGLAGVGLYFLTRRAAAMPSVDLELNVYTGPLRYTGATKPFKAALGGCFDVIYTIDVWDKEFQEFLPPTDPVKDKIKTGDLCMVQVLEPCTLYNFEAAVPPLP